LAKTRVATTATPTAINGTTIRLIVRVLMMFVRQADCEFRKRGSETLTTSSKRIKGRRFWPAALRGNGITIARL
jgi:hypothetical protein